MSWYQNAMYFKKMYGAYVDLKERFYICPDCEEPIYEEDWDDWEESSCPVCGNE